MFFRDSFLMGPKVKYSVIIASFKLYEKMDEIAKSLFLS